jgi:putative heme-binding domain-containing protein
MVDRFRSVILVACLLAPGAAGAQTNPFAGDPKAIEAGRSAFRVVCSPCHGIHGKGGRAPDLTVGVYTAGETDADLFRVIDDGVPGSEMPDFGERLGSDKIWILVSYLRSIAERRETAMRGDAAAGEKIFWEKARCGQCHQVNDRGGRLGPDLSRVGRMRSLAYLRESIVAPNAALAPGYSTIRIKTREGREIVGVQRGVDNFSAQLMDPAENFYSFLRSEVQSIERDFRSLMPGDYGSRLTSAEMDDLVAFLTRLRGREK